MTNDLKPRDWEALSVYLDRQMSADERNRMEMRLRESAELRAGLAELSRTRDVLRSQPKLRAPRNFTLSAEMAGVRQVSPAYPAFRLAAVLASILFVLVVAGDWLSSKTSSDVPMLVQAPEEAHFEMEVLEEPAASLENLTPEVQALEVPEEDLLRGPVAPLTESQVRETVDATEAMEEEGAALKALPTVLPPGLESERAAEIMPESEEEVVSVPDSQPTPTSIIEVPAEPSPGIEVESESGINLLDSILQSPVRAVEVSLALLALFTGVVALVLRRR